VTPGWLKGLDRMVDTRPAHRANRAFFDVRQGNALDASALAEDSGYGATAGRESIAIPRAFVTKAADRDAWVDQTTIPRE
jgi:hypothetical protein